MEELDSSQLLAVEEFARGLRECFTNKLTSDKDEFNRIFMIYVLQVLDIHLSLAQIKFNRYGNNFAKAHGQ